MRITRRNTTSNATPSHEKTPGPSFRHVWRVLKKHGWTSKVPRGLDISYRYIRPNQPGEQESVDFAYENELVQFAWSFDDSRDQLIAEGLSPPIGASYTINDQINNENEVTNSNIISSSYSNPNNLSENEETSSNIFSSPYSNKNIYANDIANSLSDEIHSQEATIGETSTIRGISFIDLLNATENHNSPKQNHENVGANDRDLLNATEYHTLHQHDNENTNIDFGNQLNADDINILLPGEQLEEFDDIGSGDEFETGDFFDNQDTDEQIQLENDSSDDEDSFDSSALDQAFLDQLGGEEQVMRGITRGSVLRNMEWTEIASEFENENDVSAYPNLSNDIATPTDELMEIADDPLKLFFYFLPRKLWIDIAKESNRYRVQQLDSRVISIMNKQLERKYKEPEYCLESETSIRSRLRRQPMIQSHEIVRMIGLLIARVLCPHKRRMSHHWSLTENGAVPAGTFGKFMSRSRFQFILQYLHFSDNNEEGINKDKIWKIRPVVTTLQRTFQKAWKVPAIFSFDEGMLPSTSSSNTTRQFIKDKPHRYGTKMFLTCDPSSAYCYRLELYVGKRQLNETDSESFDNLTGTAAVVRNMRHVLRGNDSGYHVVALDRFYSSVLLCIQVLTMNIYAVGTVMPSRLGFDKSIQERGRDRPKNIQHGFFKFSRSLNVPTLMSTVWWDRKPVHLVSTGSIASAATVKRYVKRRGQVTVSCPKVVSDYHSWMGGVDIHDQLRLQRYSLQLAIRFKKYYKSLFLGLVDMALVNAFITFRAARKIRQESPADRGLFMLTLHNQMLQLKAEDMRSIDLLSPQFKRGRKRERSNQTHTLCNNDDWMLASSGSRPNGVQKRSLRSCKVCSLMRPPGVKTKSSQTSFYFEECSIDDAKHWLCNRVVHAFNGQHMTCFQAWHEEFACGLQMPAYVKRKIQLRKPSGQRGEYQARIPSGDDGETHDEVMFEHNND